MKNQELDILWGVDEKSRIKNNMQPLALALLLFQ
jgi:hypothetical protein